MTDNNVSLLLQELQITNPERYELVQAVRQAIYSVVPDVAERVLYGGFMFSGEAQFCGVFACREHVSVEFGEGCDPDDPHGVLEGNGKLRRHIKLYSASYISSKYLELYVDGAYRLCQSK